ncbi:class I SAM-dependent methyltransferase [Calidifontibacter indicus]|uniref:class I SAM-dependent methyltransferase n=1 Tax=Calidifontibacter indicus TaxID=419650 RepID=UPI003D753674
MSDMKIGQIADTVLGTDVPFRLEAFDGSTGGNPDARFTVRVLNERAVQYMVTAPGELGLARGYTMGDIELDGVDPGDPYDFLAEFLGDFKVPRPPVSGIPKAVRSLGLRSFTPPPLPPQEKPAQWRRIAGGLRHSRSRDAEAIKHHYDVSNDFYELVLGPSMAYTCACYPSADATLEQAQEHKFDLVCRKLGLEPGMRLLDIGCGWGGMVRHAVKHYGVTAIGVTLSKEQADYGQVWLEREGLADRGEIRFMDYRDVAEADFDAISSIGLTEHIGIQNYPSYFSSLYEKLKPGGRLLNHCITYASAERHGLTKGGFINRYVFPDGELAPAGALMTQMQLAGFEVRHAEDLREHYARTTREWAKNLSRNWDECVRLSDLGTARIWGLYLSGSSLGFERNNIQLYQMLGQKLDDRGHGDYPLRPDFR